MAAPSVGSSSMASSSKMGNRSGSMTSSASMSSPLASSSSKARAMAASTAATSSSAGSTCCICSCATTWTPASDCALVAGITTLAPTSASRMPCNVSSTSSDTAGKKPAANWCSTRRISSAARTKHATCAGTPWGWLATCCNACSSLRAKSDKAVKPTVAELPAKECAQASTMSGCASSRFSCHAVSASSNRYDHASASPR